MDKISIFTLSKHNILKKKKPQCKITFKEIFAKIVAYKQSIEGNLYDLVTIPVNYPSNSYLFSITFKIRNYLVQLIVFIWVCNIFCLMPRCFQQLLVLLLVELSRQL